MVGLASMLNEMGETLCGHRQNWLLSPTVD